jgi:hypothetical protein
VTDHAVLPKQRGFVSFAVGDRVTRFLLIIAGDNCNSDEQKNYCELEHYARESFPQKREESKVVERWV